MRSRLLAADAATWVLVSQGTARLSAVWVFAAVAHSADAESLGVLAVATAVTAGGVVLAPPLVGQPLAVLTSPDERSDLGRRAQSFALLAATAVGAILGLGGLASDGAISTVLLASALGVPGAMAVESHYWRSVFVHGRRRAALVLSAAYAVQAGAVTAATLTVAGDVLLFAPFAALAACGAVLALVDQVSFDAARSWLLEHRRRWLPYVLGVAASVGLVQAVPVILAATAGLAAASTYRAGELVFGGTNLLIGVVVQTQLTKETPDLGRAFRRGCSVLAAVAVLNGLLLGVLPTAVLEAVVGPVTGQLQDALVPFTALRVFFAAASVGAVLMLRRLTARRAGALGVLAAGLSCLLLVLGAVTDGLLGGVWGLALAELLIAAYYGWQLRRHTGNRTP